ncbi:MAG TPA: hypothetical protein VFB62_16205, partial [Polyangiaceae bacterium]|nr:hypothetical protein [Polyangiaceae bacterium]
MIAVVDCGSAKVEALVAMIGARRIALEDARQALEADAVVISGGPHLFTAEPSLIDAFAFIDDLRVPTLGICLGHQLL